jgi:branched-chain amino acid transport system permease protein
MVIYGTVLVLMVMFAPRGIGGLGRSVRELWGKGKSSSGNEAVKK